MACFPPNSCSISGLIARLDTNSTSRQEVLDSIQSIDGVELGKLIDGRLLPLTLEASSPGELEQLHRRLQDLNGVISVDVVYAYFGQPETA
jgi:nitrate reductase NapAB chaperone NapD